MELNVFIKELESAPESIDFEQTMSVIEHNYEFTPTQFKNGQTVNEANQNNGSCKIFAFGALLELTVEQTLACFGKFYRQDVLQHPENDDHQNIRNFMISGWGGVKFEGSALTSKA
ncbi:HopJ type III effector protein [Vibrio sp. ZSDE26]|uniref:HopJ type III effector protein n=1 Tax=Vibrio amylolyticus TaxID=2847292 RepID=A0A9X1XMH5_9VIBR|nr:HopJ type III effector protein [Vibrio amylolyticus]MCK6263650.1 HopJ type III effector protein [Vibrio amylolyticus]